MDRDVAERSFSEFRETGETLPCQYVPSSWFFHRVWSDEPIVNVNDTLVAASACATCPLRRECETLGEDEGFGMWGGVTRYRGVYRRRAHEGDLPF